MITSWDDYFVHQVAEPVIKPGIDAPNFMDRMYFNAHDREGRFMIGVGLGQYRNTMRMDAIVYMVLPEKQRILRLARVTTPSDYVEPQVGALRFEVEKPLERWRWSLDDNETGNTWDLRFEANRPPVAFAPFSFGEMDGDRSDYRHFVQLGEMSGHVVLDGTRIELTDGLALRDRSWGVRRSREKQGLHLWLQHRIDDVDFFIIFNEARDGSVAYCDGAIVDADGEHRIMSVGHDLHFVNGTRDVDAATITVIDDRAEAHELRYERLLPGYVGGVGYGGWAGADHGNELEESEEIRLDQPVENILAAQPIMLFDHLCRLRYGRSTTVGSFQMGITRSASYTYRPRDAEARP